MHEEDVKIIDLEKHETKNIHDQHVNGSLTVVWRDWDGLIKNSPKMVYVSSVNPGEIKGPHIHTKRNSYFVCIHGKVLFVIKNKQGEYVEKISTADKPLLIIVPKNMASAHLNLSKGISKVLTLADVAWKPNDNEMKNDDFVDYDWNKWTKYNAE
jgi:dTDP-4-dehydrorhamnose 3,5-epimerase|tara:strand:- start:164 stop:628 length:465 start_codon:yes stop_codon:yes gene_type:complete